MVLKSGMPKILSHDPQKNKTVLCGYLDNDTFTRIVKPKHFMRTVGGYGIQEDAFQSLIEKGCKKIVIQTNSYKWEAKIEEWRYNSKILSYGHGKQRFLSLKYMKGKPPKRLTEEEKLKKACQEAML